jgi:hypothetical protein
MAVRYDPAVRAAIRDRIHAKYGWLLDDFIESVYERSKADTRLGLDFSKLFAEMAQETGSHAKPHDQVPLRPVGAVAQTNIDARGGIVIAGVETEALRELGRKAAAYAEIPPEAQEPENK